MNPVNKIDGMTVILEDRGQVFQEFDIQGGMTIATRPHPGDLWNGCVVVNEDIQVGDLIGLKSQELGTVFLKYPVIEITPLLARIQFFAHLGEFNDDVR